VDIDELGSQCQAAFVDYCHTGQRAGRQWNAGDARRGNAHAADRPALSAYGEHGVPGVIPDNALLTVEVRVRSERSDLNY